MTPDIAVLFAVLAAMAYLFFTEKLPVELTAFLGLVILVLGGYLGPGEAFSGFASPAVITMLAIFFLSTALLHTGVADAIGNRARRFLGPREVPIIVTVMLVAGCLSAFMNNIAAVAVLLPAVASLARKTGVSPARLFMPLSFGAILGGTTTLVGTPPNILAAEMLKERGIEPFRLFDFAPIGLALLGLGILFMTTLGRRLLPKETSHAAEPEGGDLAHLYHLQEAFFSVRIPRGSKLEGKTLAESRIGSMLGVQVVSIETNGRRKLAPGPDAVLRGGDRLLVHGERSDIAETFRVQGVEIVERRATDLPRPSSDIVALSVSVPRGSPIVGRTLRELRFRERFAGIVIGLVREGRILDTALGEQELREGDEILALASHDRMSSLVAHEGLEALPMGPDRIRKLLGHVFFLRVPTDSALAGATIAGSRLGELVGVTVSGIVREGRTLLAVAPDETIRPDDELIVMGDPERVRSLLVLGSVELGEARAIGGIESGDVGVVEAVIAPRSRAAGRTLTEMQFREKHGLQALAVWREGQAIRAGLASLKLRFGDALLLQGPWSKIRLLGTDPDFVVLALEARRPYRTRKAVFAVAGLMLMIAFVVTGFQPIHVAAFTAATFVVLTGAITMEEAYRNVEWRAIFLVAAILPVGIAMERTGAAVLLSQAVTDLARPFGPHAVLAGLFVLSSLLSQCLDGAPAVVILTPVALQTASTLGISPYPVMMGVSLAASAAFMTPFSHKANLLVMGAGGYRVADYLRVGTPLTILILALLVALVPVFFPI